MSTQMITILGPTASGKTTLAAHLAEHLGNAEIISADSRQVYRGMDIGTGKDLCDYTVNGVHIPYHLIDIADAGSKYNLFQYQHDFVKAYDDIMARGATPILCGGTGLYLESVIKGYHLSAVPENKELRDRLSDKTLEELTVILTELKKRNGSNMHNTTDVDTAKRAIRAIEIETVNGEHPMASADVPNIDTLVIGVDIDREERRSKISKRLRDRLDNGMVDEIRGLLDGGIPADDLIYYGLEYKYVTEYAIGRLTYEEMFEKLEIAIHQFAKRQMTWFRGMERRGTTIHWVDASLSMEEKIQYIKRLWQ
ncbi:MAG: tRNA (adenosine(37)-N6)-dimethylallyltransferase MiaA [Prevotella sp.]|nr:tRNA (adenosine(37)-N6)-dimethylallyltransferase MiaA [Prevotella sp.]